MHIFRAILCKTVVNHSSFITRYGIVASNPQYFKECEIVTSLEYIYQRTLPDYQFSMLCSEVDNSIVQNGRLKTRVLFKVKAQTNVSACR